MDATSSDHEACLVRIWHAEKACAVGGGFLLGQGRVLTCAHVVAAAFDLDADVLEPPARLIKLDFPIVEAKEFRYARLEIWKHLRAEGPKDIAGLRLVGDPPIGIRPAALVHPPKELVGLLIRATGFPRASAESAALAHAEAEVLGRNDDRSLAFQHTRNYGRFVEPGWSGTPGWCQVLGGVLGLVSCKDPTSKNRTAYMIPAEHLVRAWPALGRPTPDSCGVLRILHLANLRFCAGHTWRSDRLLKNLTETVANFKDTGLAPDIVAITGDIALSGREDEYQEAQDWIDERLVPALPDGFRQTRILVVSGDQDADPSLQEPIADAIGEMILRVATQPNIEQFLNDPEATDLLFRRHRAFLDFANRYRQTGQQLSIPWWKTRLALKQGHVHIAGLCSSWMCHGRSDDREKGRLLIGKKQVRDVLDQAESADWVLALVHHSWAFLPWFDMTEVRKEILSATDIVMRGHSLGPGPRPAIADGTCLQLEASVGHNGSNRPGAFQVVVLPTSGSNVRVHVWLEQDGMWVPDPAVGSREEWGVEDYLLNRKVRG